MIHNQGVYGLALAITGTGRVLTVLLSFTDAMIQNPTQTATPTSSVESSTLMMPSMEGTGTDLTYAATTVGAVAVVAISLVVTKRKRNKQV